MRDRGGDNFCRAPAQVFTTQEPLSTMRSCVLTIPKCLLRWTEVRRRGCCGLLSFDKEGASHRGRPARESALAPLLESERQGHRGTALTDRHKAQADAILGQLLPPFRWTDGNTNQRPYGCKDYGKDQSLFRRGEPYE